MEDGPGGNQLTPYSQRIGEVAIVAKRKAADIEIREKRLHVSYRGRTDGGIAHMAERHRPRQSVNNGLLVEMIANETETALRVKLVAVESDDAGCLLASMLKGVKPERG